MKSRYFVLTALCLTLLLVGSNVAQAQSVEIHPYGGVIFAREWADVANFRDAALWGVKGGGYVTERFEVEGNFGWLNRFQFRQQDARIRAAIYDVSGSYNFFIPGLQHFAPFVTAGVGAATAVVGEVDLFEDGLIETTDDSATFVLPTGAVPGFDTLTVESGDTFFLYTYGGGLKALNLAGPLGLRLDVRGRTMPNYFGNANTWMETTAGITFSWGER